MTDIKDDDLDPIEFDGDDLIDEPVEDSIEASPEASLEDIFEVSPEDETAEGSPEDDTVEASPEDETAEGSPEDDTVEASPDEDAIEARGDDGAEPGPELESSEIADPDSDEEREHQDDDIADEFHDQYLEVKAGELDFRLEPPTVALVAVKPSAGAGLLKFDEALTLEGQIEAVIFAAPKPLKSADILEIIQTDDEQYSLKQVDAVLSHLVRQYEERGGGFRLENVKGAGFQFRTVPAASHLMERLFSTRPRPLSRAALETLAIIAYRQPTTRAEVEFIRGVDAGSIIKNLMERGLITCVGRKEDAGRPMLFGTTDEFVKVFRLGSLGDLPPLSAFQPSPETMREANEQLAQIDGEVDVEEFIGDADRETLLVSRGLAMIEEHNRLQAGGEADQGGLTDAEELEPADHEDLIEAESGRIGATGRDLTASPSLESEENGTDSPTEVDLATGDSVPPGGREVDPGGQDSD